MYNVYDNQREANLAYLAGIIDGEGCLTIKYNKTTDVYFTSIAVGMTELPAIDLMVEMFGGKIRLDSNGNRSRPMFRWESNSAIKNREVLSDLLPYLRVKKEQALTLLACIGTIRHTGGRVETSIEVKQLRKELYNKVKELKAAAPATTNRENIREDEVIV